MAKASIVTERVALSYPRHEFDPVDLLNFIRMDGFTREWKQMRLTEVDMKALRVLIASAPTRAPIIKGTGGLRKIRFSPPKSHRGKSSGVRVCYAYIADFHIVVLTHAYPKNRQDDLSDLECVAIRKALLGFKRRLGQGPLH